MTGKKSIWTSITGGLASAAPVLLSCCKSGACIGVCASPVASLFGISSATLASSPWVMALEPLLIAISAVSFTISYYSLYKIPKARACTTPGSCDCPPDAKVTRSVNIQKFIFWIGLILSIGFIGYFEISKYQASMSLANTKCSTAECAPGSCSEGEEERCTQSCDSTSSACCTSEVAMVANENIVACKLTSKELIERKETVIASLKKQVLEKKELPDGYAFRFEGSDKMIDELSEFVKSERACCSFFKFGVTFSGNGKDAWLQLTGPKGSKEMIDSELGL